MTDRPDPGRVEGDPVRVRRASFGRWARTGKRAGYSLFVLAIAAFTVGAVGEFTPTIVRVVVACLAVGSVVLAPSIVIAYGVSAADRDESRGLSGPGRAH